MTFIFNVLTKSERKENAVIFIKLIDVSVKMFNDRKYLEFKRLSITNTLCNEIRP